MPVSLLWLLLQLCPGFPLRTVQPLHNGELVRLGLDCLKEQLWSIPAGHAAPVKWMQTPAVELGFVVAYGLVIRQPDWTKTGILLIQALQNVSPFTAVPGSSLPSHNWLSLSWGLVCVQQLGVKAQPFLLFQVKVMLQICLLLSEQHQLRLSSFTRMNQHTNAARLLRSWKTGNSLALSPRLVNTSLDFFWWHVHCFSSANMFVRSPPSGTSQPSECLLPSLTAFPIKITAAKNVLYGLGAPLCMKNVCRSQETPGVSSWLFQIRTGSDAGEGHDLTETHARMLWDLHRNGRDLSKTLRDLGEVGLGCVALDIPIQLFLLFQHDSLQVQPSRPSQCRCPLLPPSTSAVVQEEIPWVCPVWKPPMGCRAEVPERFCPGSEQCQGLGQAPKEKKVRELSQGWEERWSLPFLLSPPVIQGKFALVWPLRSSRQRTDILVWDPAVNWSSALLYFRCHFQTTTWKVLKEVFRMIPRRVSLLFRPLSVCEMQPFNVLTRGFLRELKGIWDFPN